MTAVLTSLAESYDFAGSIDVEISDPPSRIDRFVAETPYDLLLDGESVIATFHQSEDESRRSTATIARDATAPRRHFPAGSPLVKETCRTAHFREAQRRLADSYHVLEINFGEIADYHGVRYLPSRRDFKTEDGRRLPTSDIGSSTFLGIDGDLVLIDLGIDADLGALLRSDSPMTLTVWEMLDSPLCVWPTDAAPVGRTGRRVLRWGSAACGIIELECEAETKDHE